MANQPPRLERMNPVLTVRDLDRSLAFYRDVLGFHVEWTWGQPPVRAGVTRDGHEIQLGTHDPGAGETADVYFVVFGVDELFDRFRRRGAPMEREIGDRPWRLRDFQVRDPDGNKLGFGEPIGGGSRATNGPGGR